MPTSPAAPQTSVYRPDIDGLRAVAVTAVIINHFSRSALPSGHLGVDIFFVISGFVITSSLARRPGSNLNDFLLDFYTRRIKRLQPALLCFALAAGLLICFFNPTPAETIRTGMASLFGLSNIYLFTLATNYFARSTELNIFTHTWSLGVEEQFYLLFPILTWATGFSRQHRDGARNLAIITASLSLLSLLAYVILGRINQPAAYFLMPSRFWELGAGCLMFLMLQNSSQASSILSRIPPILPLAGIMGIMTIETKSKEIFSLVALTAILIACLKNSSGIYKLLTRPWMLYIGKISYSLYLWHWGILCLSRWTLGIHWWTIPFQISLMLGLAMLSYHIVEAPLRKAQWSTSRARVLGMGFGASAGASATLAVLGLGPSFSLFTGRMYPVFIEAGQSITRPYTLTGSSFDGESARNFTWSGNDCVLHDNTAVGKRIRLDQCTLGESRKADQRILVLGNSYSASFTQAFDQLVLSDHRAVSITSSFGAAPVPGVKVRNLGYHKSSAYYWRELVPHFLSELRPGDWVFLVNDLAEYSPEQRTLEDEARTEQIRQGLLNLSQQLSPKGIRLAVLHGLPFVRESNCEPAVAARQWYNSFGKGPCQFLSKRESLRRRKQLDAVLKDLERQGKLTVVDLFDTFCPGEACTFNAQSGELLYRDGASHPSIEAVRLAAPGIRSLLASP